MLKCEIEAGYGVLPPVISVHKNVVAKKDVESLRASEAATRVQLSPYCRSSVDKAFSKGLPYLFDAFRITVSFKTVSIACSSVLL